MSRGDVGLWALRRAVTLAVLAFLAVGCSSSAGEAVASRIRDAGSPFVREVVFRPGNLLDPPETDVWLRPGVSDQEAELLWCEVIVPAGGTDEGATAVVVWDDPGTTMMAIGVMCQ